jgi:hypothetical protein
MACQKYFKVQTIHLHVFQFWLVFWGLETPKIQQQDHYIELLLMPVEYWMK